MNEPNMLAREPQDDALEAQIAKALARRPAPAVPYGFATRVARRAVAQPAAPMGWGLPPALRWGPRMAVVGAVALVVLMAVLAGGEAHRQWVLASTQTLCMAEFVAAVYAATRLGQLWR